MPTREHDLEAHLGECIRALEALLACPDLNLDSLEQATQEAIERAHTVLQTVQAARRAMHVHQEESRQDVCCVYCGKPIPGEQWTEADRGMLVAYIHRACHVQAELSTSQ